jgi:DGQHR domain-containing protein
MPTFRYACLVTKQRADNEAPTFCLFHAPVGEILTWADIKRLEDEPGAPQRRTSPAKVKAIKRFLDTDPRNTIPTSVILTIDIPLDRIHPVNVNGTHSFAFVDIEVAPNGPKPGLVIDGQHRLLGMKDYAPDTDVNVVAILAASDEEKAFQFLVINNKASKVSMDHIRALALHFEPVALKARLETARLNLDPNVGYVGLVNNEEDSPFRGMISWPLTPEQDRVIVPASIEASIGYIQQKRVRAFESDDVLLEFFYTIWRRIKEKWPDLWNNDSRLLNKVGVICMSQYMTDALISSYDLGNLDVADPDQVAALVDEILLNQKRDFWKVPWTSTSYDTKVGRTLIVASLVQIGRNIRAGVSWHEDVELVDSTTLDSTPHP